MAGVVARRACQLLPPLGARSVQVSFKYIYERIFPVFSWIRIFYHTEAAYISAYADIGGRGLRRGLVTIWRR
jgi:hypothetical protein